MCYKYVGNKKIYDTYPFIKNVNIIRCTIVSAVAIVNYDCYVRYYHTLQCSYWVVGGNSIIILV